MSYSTRLKRAFDNAVRLPLTPDSRYVLMSDCHRGVGNTSDNFLKNQNLFFAALQYYYNEDFTYIELGDGDELWENRTMSQIIEIHDNTFWLISKFNEEKRLYMLYGNHDIVKSRSNFAAKNCAEYYCPQERCNISLFPNIIFHEGIILEDSLSASDIFLTHGHQADALNSTFWRLSRFLVRYLWGPLERIGFRNPTSAAKNNTRKDRVERNLLSFAREEEIVLVAGHTHRPMLDIKKDTPYINTGCCVHPRCITTIELIDRCFTLVKWTYCTRPDFTVYICREVLAGPICIGEFQVI